MLRKGRQSIAFFVHPDDEVMVRCLDGSGKYEEISSIDYLNMRFSLTYDKWRATFKNYFCSQFEWNIYDFIYLEIFISFKSYLTYSWYYAVYVILLFEMSQKYIL